MGVTNDKPNPIDSIRLLSPTAAMMKQMKIDIDAIEAAVRD